MRVLRLFRLPRHPHVGFPWPDANAGGSSVTSAVVEAHPELEL
jgi:hypothetical protein